MRTTILVVEDNDTEQYVLRALLAKFDYVSHGVAFGEEALAAVKTTKFAAILMDITLPGIDGHECTRQIRSFEVATGAHTPIIALTGRAEKEDRETAILAGVDDYISKPFDPEDLRRILLRWVYEPDRPNLKVLQPSNVDESSAARKDPDS